MRANYHTHTPRCHHARGSEREYVEAAVTAGLEILGFSDHTPYIYDVPGYVSTVRMLPGELEGYVSTVSALREEYAGRLELHIGLEAEYYPKLFPRLLELLRGSGVEYLLLGQHFLGNEADEPYCGRPTASRHILERYVSQCIEGMDTGCFTYLAHPDLINYQGDDKLYRQEMRRLCRGAKDRNIPLEINLLGSITGRNYPDRRFWRIAAEEGCQAVLGCDAHQPEGLLIPELCAWGENLARELGLALLETVPLRPPLG